MYVSISKDNSMCEFNENSGRQKEKKWMKVWEEEKQKTNKLHLKMNK